MLRVAHVCVPPGTGKDKPYTQKVALEGAMLREVLVLIPPGHRGVTGVRIKYGLELLLPYHQDDWIIGDNISVTDKLYWPLPESPVELVVEAYNDSDAYTHCFHIYFSVDLLPFRMEEVMARMVRLMADMFNTIKGFIDRLLPPRR